MRDTTTLEAYIRNSTSRWVAPGMVPLVTESVSVSGKPSGTMHLWQAMRRHAQQLTQEDRTSTERLLKLVDRHLPVSLGLATRPPVPSGVQVRDRSWLGVTDGVVSGQSRDLSVALSLASQRLGVPLLVTLFASGELDDAGNVRSVDGLTSKALAATASIPEEYGRVRFLVCRNQGNLEEASRAVRMQQGIVPEWCEVSTLQEAFDVAFGWTHNMTHEQRLAKIHPYAVGEEAAERANIALWADHQLRRAFYGHTSGRLGRGDIKDWRPILEAHQALLNLVPEENPVRGRFRWVVAASARHAHQQKVVELPEEDLLRACPADVAVGWIAHVVQQATDGGSGDTAVETLLANWLPVGRDLTAAELRLLGARGRRRQAQGRLREAWDDSMAATRGWIDRFEAADATYPLSVLYLLIGTFRDASLLDEVDDLWRIVEPEIDAGSPSLTWVLAARFRALVELGDIRKATDCDRKIREHGVTVANVEPCLLRWRLALRRLDDPDVVMHEESLKQLRAEQQMFLRLLESLHQAVRHQNPEQAVGALTELTHEEGMIRTHLLPNCPHQDPCARAEWLLRYYPYF
jgi:hypothetical protein